MIFIQFGLICRRVHVFRFVIQFERGIQQVEFYFNAQHTRYEELTEFFFV